jgi:hypothetical protein
MTTPETKLPEPRRNEEPDLDPETVGDLEISTDAADNIRGGYTGGTHDCGK